MFEMIHIGEDPLTQTINFAKTLQEVERIATSQWGWEVERVCLITFTFNNWPQTKHYMSAKPHDRGADIYIVRRKWTVEVPK